MRFATLLVLLLALPACDGAVWESADRVPLRVDIQSQFDDDRVRLEVGGVPIFDARVTTLDVLSLAQIVEANVPPGETVVEATVNDGPSTRVTLNPEDLGGIAVGFDGQTVSVTSFETPPLYD